MILQYILLLLILIGGHFIGDYVLQGDSIARGKNRNIDSALYGVPWQYWLTSHAATHGMIVGIATHNTYAGLFEFVAHSLIDFGKCEKKYGIHTDQFLHLICKIVIIITLAIVGQ